MNSVKKTLVIGAGMNGLLLAKELSHQTPFRKITLWEKSPGVGGRVATRRGNRTQWDHGAQFYVPDGLLAPYHAEWVAQGKARAWPYPHAKKRFYAPHGMNSLAKELALGLDIHKNRKAIRLQKNDRASEKFWIVTDESQTQERFDEVILTCPLPQSIALLTESQLDIPASWLNVDYAPALVALVKSEAPLREVPLYQEFTEGPLFSWSNMQAKGLSEISAWTWTSRPEWAKTHWDQKDEEVIDLLKTWVSDTFRLDLHSCDFQLKRWRYSHPLQCLAPEQGRLNESPLLLASGDAFYAGSVGGAAMAAKATLPWILS